MKTQFTQWLRAYRHVNGMSAREAAVASGISSSTWRQYESGAKAGDTGLTSLAEFFGCEPAKLQRMAEVPCDADVFTKAASKGITEAFAQMG